MDKIIIFLLLSFFLLIADNEKIYNKHIQQEKINIQKNKLLSTIRNVNFLIETLHYDNKIAELEKIKLLIRFNELKISIFKKMANNKQLLVTNINLASLKSIYQHLIKIYQKENSLSIEVNNTITNNKKQEKKVQNKILSYFINSIYKNITRGRKENAKIIYEYLLKNFPKLKNLFKGKFTELLI